VKSLVDGTVKRLTYYGGFVPTWSPDGSKIAFVSSRTGKNQIFVMPSTGGTQVRITNNTFVEYGPAWAY
jgi:Tol biopolymer transport system component